MTAVPFLNTICVHIDAALEEERFFLMPILQ